MSLGLIIEIVNDQKLNGVLSFLSWNFPLSVSVPLVISLIRDLFMQAGETVSYFLSAFSRP